MNTSKLEITMRWPKNSMGLDISQVEGALREYLRHYNKPKKFNCGSGRSISIREVKVK